MAVLSIGTESIIQFPSVLKHMEELCDEAAAVAIFNMVSDGMYVK